MPAAGSPIVVVSGLPRSGTSMVMAMLNAGGLEIVSDGVRAADESNPGGYYEDERVKTLDAGTDQSWLEEARGKAIKIISFLLKNLPDSNRYLVIFMRRDLDEVLTSQRRMLDARGEASEPTDDERLAMAYRAHLNAVHELLSSRSCFDVLELSYEAIIDRPGEHAERIDQFVGGGLDVAKMAAVVDPALYRNRA